MAGEILTDEERGSFQKLARLTREYMREYELAGFTREEAFKLTSLWWAKSTATPEHPLHIGFYL